MGESTWTVFKCFHKSVLCGSLLLVLVACDKAPDDEVTQPVSTADEVLVEYNSDIRPILSDKCFFCHGPDEANNKAGLRLDTAEAAFAQLKEGVGHAIVPGESEKSAVWQRISTDDPDLVMPPPDAQVALTVLEKDLIKRWIDQGAEFQEHWAFVPLPESIAKPAQGDAEWGRNEVDHFISVQHQNLGFSPNSAADPLTWLRRASFDLTGLPPSLEMIDRFKGKSEAEYEAMVDEFLASEHYGEHMAVGWLDAARYADSYGFQSDKLNNQWPYRDWVVKAFNDNLGYDKFLTYNLAGDLLENPTREQLQATAFNRLHRLTNEGGSIEEEFLVENAADRLHTFGTAVLGLTMECARCHDHKYDPISAKDYYSLFAFFNSIPENGLYDNPSKVPSPTMLLPNPQQERTLEGARNRIAHAEKELKLAKEAAEPSFQEWKKQVDFRSALNGLSGHYEFEESLSSVKNLVNAKEKPSSANGLKPIVGPSGQAVQFNGDQLVRIHTEVATERGHPFSLGFRIKDNEKSSVTAAVAHKTWGTEVGYNGFDVLLRDGFLELRLYRVWPGNGIGIRSKVPLTQAKWHQVAFAYDGSNNASGMQLSIDGTLVEVEELGSDVLLKSATGKGDGIGPLTLGPRFRGRGFKGGALDSIYLYQRDLTAIELNALSSGMFAKAIRYRKEDHSESMLRDYYLTHHAGAVHQAKAKLNGARRHQVSIENRVFEVSIMKELKAPRPTYILERGEYDSPKHEENRVERDVFEEILPRFPEGQPKNRLGLAQWLLDPSHPLTSRVFVNRVWQNFFGNGLVGTSDNFGLQGSLPSHPKLLDWLSRDFIQHGWDIKRLHKQIVLSATYRQSSSVKKEVLERDPENRWLARGQAHRLGAEQLRDQVLVASGLLNPQMGGAPVSPYQPGKDLWRESNSMSPAYRQSKGDALLRRSIYSVWKRTAPLPNMTAFDATSREVCSVKRSSTNTPMQALVLLNDVQFVEAARALATKVILQDDDHQIRVRHAFLSLTGRAPIEAEMQLLLALYQEQLEHYRERGDAAKKLVSHGESKVNEAIEPVELAAMTVLCQAMINLDASVWKR